MKEHQLKVWPEQFQAIIDGKKQFEWRKDDRGGFEVGDHLILHEWDPNYADYTGRGIRVEVTWVTRTEFEMPMGYVVMSIRRIQEEKEHPKIKGAEK